jgi:hypothetical protein
MVAATGIQSVAQGAMEIVSGVPMSSLEIGYYRGKHFGPLLAVPHPKPKMSIAPVRLPCGNRFEPSLKILGIHGARKPGHTRNLAHA